MHRGINQAPGVCGAKHSRSQNTFCAEGEHEMQACLAPHRAPRRASAGRPPPWGRPRLQKSIYRHDYYPEYILAKARLDAFKTFFLAHGEPKRRFDSFSRVRRKTHAFFFKMLRASKHVLRYFGCSLHSKRTSNTTVTPAQQRNIHLMPCHVQRITATAVRCHGSQR